MLDPEAGLPELRLAYVAATRAALALDVTRVPVFDDIPVPTRAATVAPAAALAAPLALEAGDE
jgi:ATP-dependent exoDNAse (exonuclease V) beta subunit